MSERVIVG